MSEKLTILTKNFYIRPQRPLRKKQRILENWYNLFYAFILNKNYMITREHDLLLDYHLRYNDDSEEIMKNFPNIRKNIQEHDIEYDKSNFIEEMHFINAPKRIIDCLGIPV